MPFVIDEQFIEKHIDSVFYQHGLNAWKNPDSTYLSMTDFTARMVGFKRGFDAVGATDYDLACPAVESANLFQTVDQDVLARNQNRQSVAFDEYTDGWKLFCAEHIVVQNLAGKPIGLMIGGQEITALPLLSFGVALNQIFREKIIHRKSFIADLAPRYEALDLSEKQSQCLFYYLNGYAAKEIAKLLQLSSRTIETHIENIKCLLDCSTKRQLFEKISHAGLLDLIIT